LNSVATFTLSCTGAGGGADASTTVTIANQAPTANAGPDQSPGSGTTVTLTGSASSDADGTIASYSWSQTAGSTVVLSSASAVSPTFAAPTVATATALTFRLVVTDNSGATSMPDTVTISVQPPSSGVQISGRVTFDRIPLSTTLGAGLDYNAMRRDPARGVLVQTVTASTQQVIASTRTDGNGDYSLSVTANTNIIVGVVADMTRAAPLPLPHWQFRVRDFDGNVGYVHSEPSFNSGTTAVIQNLHVPSGWDAATRQPNGIREAAPFAILDTVYVIVNALLAIDPALDFPPLTLDWHPANLQSQGTSYNNDGGGSNRRIRIAGEAGVDTDEYDPDVLAHEFGHYVEDRFSRTDSIGMAHRPGDRLDTRVAFGEGFGYAFAGMLLGRSISRDTQGPLQASEGFFNMESGVVTNPGWFSEASAYQILWDLFDSTAEASDQVQLGLGPLWQVLVGSQRTTDALTSIFPFVTALKQQNPTLATQIDQVVAAQSIVSATMDIYGTTETNSAGSTDVLPIYTPISIGGPAKTVRSTVEFDPLRERNKLSVRRFLRLDVSSTQTVRITVVSGIVGRDVDMIVRRRGAVLITARVVGDENFTVSLSPGAHVLEVYDYANAFGGTSATTPITVTVTP
jgi:hypothetical protein